MNIEFIIWRDSVSRGGWHYPDTLAGFKGRSVTTVGIVVEEDDSDILLAMSIGDAGGGPVFCNILSIPKECITERSVVMALQSSDAHNKIIDRGSGVSITGIDPGLIRDAVLMNA